MHRPRADRSRLRAGVAGAMGPGDRELPEGHRRVDAAAGLRGRRAGARRPCGGADRQGRVRGALKEAGESRNIAVGLGADDLLWRALVSLSRAQRKLKQTDEAIGTARAAVLAVRGIAEAAAKRPGHATPRDVTIAYANVAILHAEAGNATAAWDVIEEMRVRALRNALASNERDISPRDDRRGTHRRAHARGRPDGPSLSTRPRADDGQARRGAPEATRRVDRAGNGEAFAVPATTLHAPAGAPAVARACGAGDGRRNRSSGPARWAARRAVRRRRPGAAGADGAPHGRCGRAWRPCRPGETATAGRACGARRGSRQSCGRGVVAQGVARDRQVAAARGRRADVERAARPRDPRRHAVAATVRGVAGRRAVSGRPGAGDLCGVHDCARARAEAR